MKLDVLFENGKEETIHLDDNDTNPIIGREIEGKGVIKDVIFGYVDGVLY